MSRRSSKKTSSHQKALQEITLHQNLVFVRTPDVKTLEELLKHANLRQKVVCMVDPTAILIPRSATAAFRKRIAKLGLPEIVAPTRSLDEHR